MTSEELAKEIDHVMACCRGRVLGVGHEQYSMGAYQKFETLPAGELVAWAMEELQDLIVYATMELIRLKRIQAMVDSAITKVGGDGRVECG